MKATQRIESIIAAVVLIEDLPSGDPSNIVHDLRKVSKVVEKLNKRETALVEALEKAEANSKQATVLLDDIGARVAEIMYHHSIPKKSRHGNTTRTCEDIKTRLAVAKALLATHTQEEARQGETAPCVPRTATNTFKALESKQEAKHDS